MTTSALAPISKDVYVKRLGAKTGKLVITQHLAWDPVAFVEAESESQRKERDKPDGTGDYDIIGTATREEYRALNWPKKVKP